MKHPDIFETIQLATRLHSGQRDKSGVPYIAHPLAVMRRLPERLWHVGVLHDVIEDSEITAMDLYKFGYAEYEIAAIASLSRGAMETYRDFIERVIENGPDAIAVKIADLDDNLDPSRPAVSDPVNANLMKRYREARLKLELAR